MEYMVSPRFQPKERPVNIYEGFLVPNRQCVARKEVQAMQWRTLRKSAVSLFVEYGNTFSNNLWAYNLRARLNPQLEISADLNPNLRSRNRQENGYLDARELADGRISELKTFQVTDEYAMENLRKFLRGRDDIPGVWCLRIELEGEHVFDVEPEYYQPTSSLILRVIS